MGVMEDNNLFLIPQSQAQGGAQFKWDVQQLPSMEKGPPSIKSLLGGAYLQEKDAPLNKKAIVDSLLAAKPMPKPPRWWEMDQGITIKSLARIRAGAVSVNEGLSDLDRQLNAVLQRR